MESLRLTRVSMNDPRLTVAQDGRPAVVAKDAVLFPTIDRQFPPVSFGDVDPAGLDIPDQNAVRDWSGASGRIAEVFTYLMNDVTVHSPEGIITVGDFVIDETLAHIPFHHPGYKNAGACIEIPKPAALVDVETALHGMCGNFGNYYHWMLDILPRLQVAPLASRRFHGPILLPPAVTDAQKDIARLLAGGPSPLFLLGQRHAARVKSLLYVPRMSGFGFAPNPHIGAIFGRVKQLLGVEARPSRRLYVTRRDSTNRVMLNEDAVRVQVERHGFETVMLSGLSIAEQARLFAAATHIIAPHGAGLANLMFCAPGTKVLELHMNVYMNWCMRALCGAAHLTYGCLVGTADPRQDQATGVHARNWTAPVDRLVAAMNDPAFLARDRAEAATPAQVRPPDAFAFLRGAAARPPDPLPKPRLGGLRRLIGAR